MKTEDLHPSKWSDPKPIDLNDPVVKELINKVISGELHFEAPCEGANTPWTDEEISDFIKMLNED